MKDGRGGHDATQRFADGYFETLRHFVFTPGCDHDHLCCSVQKIPNEHAEKVKNFIFTGGSF